MIRKAVINDIEHINKLGIIFNENFLATYNVKDYLENENYIIVVNEDEYVNAFIIMYKNIDYFELEAIVVDPSAREKGIATNLLNFFIREYSRNEDIILLEVAVNNTAAISLYKKFNFEIINTRKKYYKNVDAYVMKKVI